VNWREWLRLDLGALVGGRGIVAKKPKRLPTGLRPRRKIFAEFLAAFARVPLWPYLFLERLRLTARHLALSRVLEQLARIVACNAPLVPALDELAYDAPDSRTLVVLLNLRDGLQEGLTLSEAMRAQPKFFPPYCCDLVEAGENTGTLHAVLTDLVKDLGESSRLAGDVLLMLCYFGFVLMTGTLITVFIAMKVFPVFFEILQDFGQEVPWTVTLIADAASTTVWQSEVFWLAAWGCLILLGVILWIGWRNPTFAHGRARVGMAVPFVRTLLAQTNLARGARILGRLIDAGYPLDEALESTARAHISPVYTAAFGRLSDHVRHGNSMAQALEMETRLMPPWFRGTVAVGESTGRLPEWLARAAHYYERHARKATRIAVRVLFPLGILAMGCVVMFVYSSLFLVLSRLIDGMLAGM